jgi:hypothetical protein
MKKIQLKDFLSFYTNLNSVLQGKHNTKTTSFIVSKLSSAEYGSDVWQLCYDHVMRQSSAINTFNMWKELLHVAIFILESKRMAIKPEYVNIIKTIYENWDTYICTPAAIENYILYYNDTNIKPVHPILYMFKNIGSQYLKSENIVLDEETILKSVEGFLKNNDLTFVPRTNFMEPPEQTQTPLVLSDLMASEPIAVPPPAESMQPNISTTPTDPIHTSEPTTSTPPEPQPTLPATQTPTTSTPPKPQPTLPATQTPTTSTPPKPQPTLPATQTPTTLPTAQTPPPTTQSSQVSIFNMLDSDDASSDEEMDVDDKLNMDISDDEDEDPDSVVSPILKPGISKLMSMPIISKPPEPQLEPAPGIVGMIKD